MYILHIYVENIYENTFIFIIIYKMQNNLLSFLNEEILHVLKN